MADYDDTSDSLITDIRDRFEYMHDFWDDIRSEGQKDMRFVKGDPWDDKDREMRKNRPLIAPDELNQYFNQTINDVRANPRAVKFSPTGDGANDKAAKFYANKMREIEYRSNAQIAYTTAFENAVQQSRGYCRIQTKFASDTSFDKELWIEAIPNPNMVLPDPEALRPDSSDMRDCFIYEQRRIADFKREFPKAKVQDFASWLERAPLWIKSDTLMLAEYWKIKTKPRKLLLIQPAPVQPPSGMMGFRPQAAPPPKGIFEDELELERLPPGAKIIRDRTVDWPEVCQYLTNGIEILKETPWPGKFIPIVSCYGKVLYVDEGVGAKRHILSMTRLARDPWKLYCYYRSQQAEIAGMIPKVPVMGYKGQFRGMEQDWQKAAHEPVAFLQFNGQTEATGQQVLPPPMRLDYPSGEHLQSLELCAEGARRSIQAAMGASFLPTSAQRQNEKSGVALEEIQASAQRGTFHYVDNYDHMIRQVGVIIEDLITPVIDTARDVGVILPDGQAATERVNDPGAEHDDGTYELSTKGSYVVTISTGPSVDSERDAAGKFADTLVSNLESIAALAGPKVGAAILAKSIKLKNLGAIADDMADLIMPPEFKQEGQQPQVPPQVMAQLQAMQQRVQELEQMLATDQVKAQATLQGKQMDNETKMAIESIKADLAILLQQMKGRQDASLQDDEQRHDMAIHAADASEAKAQMDRADLRTVAGMGAEKPGGKPNGSGQAQK